PPSRAARTGGSAMSPADDDARLRAALAEAHRQDPEAPALSSLWSTRERSRRPRRLAVAFLAGLATAAAAGILLVSRPPPPPPWPPIGPRWVAPTDSLLDTPDLVTLRTVPTLHSKGLP